MSLRPETVNTPIRDYLPLLKQAIAEARTTGLVSAVNDLERAAFAAHTTSSEMLQEHGMAIRHFLKVSRDTLPRETRRKLEACLAETELATTGWRGLLARLKRRPSLG